MKALAIILVGLIGFTALATYDEEAWDALSQEEKQEIIKELVIPFAQKHDASHFDVEIQREGKKVNILIRPKPEEA